MSRAAAKPAVQPYAKSMLDNNIVKATGDKLAAGRAAAAVKMPARPVSKTAAVLKALKGIFSGQGGLGDQKRPTAAPKKKSNAR